MKLIASLTSPYARKVRIVLAEKKIDCPLEEDVPWNADTRVGDYNPLGKVPVLELDDGSTLYDSRVIAEYLDNISPVSRILPQENRLLIATRRWEALADGIVDAAVAIVLEKRRPATIAFLRKLYANEALPNELAKQCGCDFSSLDREYRDFLKQAAQADNAR